MLQSAPPPVGAAAQLRVLDPLEYHRAHHRQGVRPDGRALLRGRKPRLRECPLNISADGSALLRLGNTAVIAGVQCEPTAPAPGDADAAGRSGRIVVNVEFSAVCSAATANAMSAGHAGAGRLERAKAVLVEQLQRAASGGLVDLETLCAVEGTAVWSCYCDLYVLEHDGNLEDAAVLALQAALVTVRLPKLELDEASGALTVVEEGVHAVSLAAPLYPCTFGLLSGEVLLDPTSEEEALLSGAFTLMLDGAGEMRALHKPGGAPLPDGCLPRCVAAARERLPALVALIGAGR